MPEMQTAIVTHASTGLGPSLRLALAERGWRLVLDHGNVVDAGQREALVAAAGPRIDLLVNNAAPGARHVRPTSNGYPLDALEDAYRESVLAPLALIQLALPRLAPDGCIVNVIPRSAGADVRQSAAAALEQLTAAIAAAFPRLRIHAVDPAAAQEISVLDAIVGEAVPA